VRPMLTRRLSQAHPAVLVLYAVAVSFTAYAAMYAFRKPFAAGTYAGHVDLWGVASLDLKSLYVISQVIGYAASKFLGIKVVSELPGPRRAAAILGLVGFGWLALLGFALVPAPYNALCLTLNGLPLGMIWGLVFGFLEGRKTSDLLAAGLCGSYILASGFVKTLGTWVLHAGVPEVWMPFVTGAIAFPVLIAAVAGLTWLPPPTPEDEAARVRRAPMDGPARLAFFRAYAPGLVLMVVAYMLLAAFRDFRDNFAREIWDALGYRGDAAVLTAGEVPAALAGTLILGAMMLWTDNRRAVAALHAVMFAGGAMIGLATIAWGLGWISGAAWMVTVGVGLYLAYVPCNGLVFERVVAASGSVATAGFLIYVADAFGYLSSVGVLLYKNFGKGGLSWLQFLIGFCHTTALATMALFLLSGVYFWYAFGERSPRLAPSGMSRAARG
jgi:hypothetical protein